MSREGLKKQGYLYKLPVKGLVKKWTKRWFVLYGTTHEGVARLEYFDNPEAMVTSSGKRTIPLRDCTDITATIGSKVHPYAFHFTSQLGHHVLATETQPEVDSWIDSIKGAIQEDRIKRRRSKAQSRITTTSGSDIEQSTGKGICYKNKVDSGTYRVTVEENETSQKMNLTGTYNLELGPSKIALVASSGATIFTLSYKFLKNYGKQSGQFHFETGKNSPIGEGGLVFVTTCSKEIFGVVHNNIKRLKDQAERKLSSEGAPPKPSTQAPLRVKPPPPKSSQSFSSERTIIGGRPSSRNSTEIAVKSMPGTYRSSRNMEEEPTSKSSANQQKMKQDDPSALYAVVDKSKKMSAKEKEEKTAPVAPQPYGTQGSGPESSHSDQLAAKRIRDSRLSTMLVEIDDNAFNDSFEEDDDDNVGYDENLEPLSEGVRNPFDDDGDIDGDIDGDAPQGNIETNSNPPIDVALDGTSSPLNNDQGQEQKLNAPSVSAGNTFDTITEPPKANNMEDFMESLDFGFGPGNLKPATDQAATLKDKDGASGNSALMSNSQANRTLNLLGDLDFGSGSANVQQTEATALSPGNTAVMPDLNFDFGYLPPIPGFGAAGNDPFSNPTSVTGNIAELDFGSLDTNFFDKLEAMDVKDQAPSTSGPGAAAFDNIFDNWGQK